MWRQRPFAALVALGLAAAGTPAEAQQFDAPSPFDTAEHLLRACQGANDYDVGLCQGFILGNLAFYENLLLAEAVRPWSCADPVPSVDEIRALFVDWGRAHPEGLGQTAIDGLWSALVEAYPC